MLLKILPNNASGYKGNRAVELVTLAENECLPQIIAGAFGWEAVTLEYTNGQGVTDSFGACRKGHKIVMLPHFSYGPDSDTKVATEIITALRDKGYSCEWRLTTKASEFSFTDKVTTLLPLQADAELQFHHLNSNLKRKIRKSTRNGIEIKTGKSELLRDFYEVYSRNMHRLGSPALPRRWFAALLAQYRNGETGIWCAYLNEKPVGAAFLLEYKGFYEACWFSTLQKYNRQYASYGLYWHIISYAAEHKGVYFSFGRSTQNSGVHKFKQQWGGIDLPLVWNYSHPQGRNIRSFTFLSTLWKLLPFPVARLLGPVVSGRFY